MDAPKETGGFARQQARTRRFTLGVPRSFTVAPDGSRVVFLRSSAGDDPANSLWVYDVASRTEREVASPKAVLGAEPEALSPEERARRERSRELAGGIVGYACDEAVEHAAFSLAGQLWWVALVEEEGSGAEGVNLRVERAPGASGGSQPVPGTRRPPVRLPAPAGAVDPRPDPLGNLVGFCAGPALYAVPTAGEGRYFVLASEAGNRAEGGNPSGAGGAGQQGAEDVSWGSAEFIAAEEMGRSRGYWWAPDGGSLLAARVDSSPVGVWWTADASSPGAPPEPHRYPAAGTADALVSLWLLEAVPGGGRRRRVGWDAERYPYLVTVQWVPAGPPLLLVEQRDHKACSVLMADPASGATEELVRTTDPAWVSWPAGLPTWLEGGKLVWARADSGTWRLEVDGELVTPPGLQVREVASAGRSLVFSASSEPEVVEAWSWSPTTGLCQLTRQGGVSSAVGDGPVKVVASRTMRWHGARVEVQVEGSEPRALANLAELPVVEPSVTFLRVGERQLSVGVCLPKGHAGGKLPVIMAPYGGPGHQRVLASRAGWLEAQWVADQGFAVVVADGRGTPGRGPEWEHEVYLDLAGPVLEDQVAALQAVAGQLPELDLSRVGVQGWSFGGYLAALAVLARPDVFHAAFAGAPVTDWRLYDTYYTERFLGHPARQPEAYERSSLLRLAPGLSRPLMLVHGLSDDNVYAAHTLELSGALFKAQRVHSVLPLPGITHVASQEAVAEGLLVLGVEFFRQALASPATS
jgi:dipeptidyl-peptidase-4